MSICSGDPKWFHEGMDRDHCFFDSRGIYNGLVATPLCLSEKNLKYIESLGGMCCKGCKQNTNTCLFKHYYYEQLKQTPFDIVKKFLNDKIIWYSSITGIGEDSIDIAFMVYEQPYNPCSEREVVARYLKDNGIELKEYTPDLVDKHILF